MPPNYRMYPVFQHLRAKAETHALKFRPKESRKLQQLGQFEQVLDQRTQAAWNVLARMRHQGALLNEAEEFALPHVLVPDESEDLPSVTAKREALAPAAPGGAVAAGIGRRAPNAPLF